MRQTPKQLVSKCAGRDKTPWFTKLSDKDQKYVYAVVDELRKTGAGFYPVARLLVKELGIKRSHEVVARTLKELLNER